MLEEKIVKLKRPVELKGGKKLTEITITEPTAKAMTGFNRLDLLTMKDETHKIILPRITKPQITKNIYEKISVKDLGKIMEAVLSFFIDEED